MKYIVNCESELLYYLIKNSSKKSKDLKSLLKHKCILVNNKVVTLYNYKLHINDVIYIKKYSEIDILYEDNDLIVVNKEEGLLTISTLTENINTLYRKVSNYVKLSNKSNKVFIVNRLDKDTSGIVVFAKNIGTKKYLQDNWSSVSKYYVTVVKGITEKSGTIKSFLKENDEYYVYSSSTGKEAITKYTLIKSNNNFSLLKVELVTGRKNQIRVHMKDINHPIIGDSKYGVKGGRLMLHAYNIKFKYKNKNYNIICNYDDIFNEMVM